MLAPIKVFFTSVFTWMKRVMLTTQEYAKNLLHALRCVMKSAGVRAWSHVRTAFHSISKRKALICDLVRSVKSSCRFAISHNMALIKDLMRRVRNPRSTFQFRQKAGGYSGGKDFDGNRIQAQEQQLSHSFAQRKGC